MARDHARLRLEIWQDPDFCRLRIDEQWLYITLLTQPRLTYCGCLDYHPKRLTQLASNLTMNRLTRSVNALEQRRFIVIDHQTEELLIRSFVRHDGLLSQPNVTKAMLKNRAEMISPRLRKVVDQELQRAFSEDPGLAGWETIAKVDGELYARVCGIPLPKGSGKGSGGAT